MEGAGMDDLPEEVLEFILSLISPYKDLHDCMLVSKKWRRCVLNVVKIKQRNLYKAINDFDVRWDKITPTEMAPTIAKRYSHTAAVHENSMYVFGGCTCAMTTFNDLWRLDLSKRQWIRPVAMGTYPSPKACSSLTRYEDMLILFGGWAYPPSYPLYQSWHLFDELHVYDIPGNSWKCVTTTGLSPAPVAGHSASIINNTMVVFGGLHKPNTAVHCEKSNEVWVLNLEDWTWKKPQIETGPKPHGRFGQTQVVLDNENILIVGGSGGPSFYYADAWLLNMSDKVWKWSQVSIKGKSHEPTNIWSNPGCKIGDKIVVLNKIKNPEVTPLRYHSKSSPIEVMNPPDDGRLSRIDLANRPADKDDNVNGRRGTLRTPKREADDESAHIHASKNLVLHGLNSGVNSMAAFNGPDQRKREDELKRLERLEKMKVKFKTAGKREKKTHYLGIYVLDISQVLTHSYATWLPPKNINIGPEETILYTLVEGKSELIMFGGIQKEPAEITMGYSTNLSSQISNSLHFITAPSYVI